MTTSVIAPIDVQFSLGKLSDEEKKKTYAPSRHLCFKMLHYIILTQVLKKKKPSHIVCEEVAPAGCAVKLNVTGGMARS